MFQGSGAAAGKREHWSFCLTQPPPQASLSCFRETGNDKLPSIGVIVTKGIAYGGGCNPVPKIWGVGGQNLCLENTKFSYLT